MLEQRPDGGRTSEDVGGGVFQAEGIACAKVLGQKHAGVYREDRR